MDLEEMMSEVLDWIHMALDRTTCGLFCTLQHIFRFHNKREFLD
jgi:hypothetical protein